jgi:hypothetical protein
MKQEVLVKADQTEIIDYVELKLRRDFPYHVDERPRDFTNVVEAYRWHGLLPHTVGGWLFNLLMLAITGGVWTFVYLIWASFKMTARIYGLDVRALPADEEGVYRVVVTTPKDDWGKVVLGWLEERYGGFVPVGGGWCPRVRGLVDLYIRRKVMHRTDPHDV